MRWQRHPEEHPQVAGGEAWQTLPPDCLVILRLEAYRPFQCPSIRWQVGLLGKRIRKLEVFCQQGFTVRPLQIREQGIRYGHLVHTKRAALPFHCASALLAARRPDKHTGLKYHHLTRCIHHQVSRFNCYGVQADQAIFQAWVLAEDRRCIGALLGVPGKRSIIERGKNALRSAVVLPRVTVKANWFLGNANIQNFRGWQRRRRS